MFKSLFKWTVLCFTICFKLLLNLKQFMFASVLVDISFCLRTRTGHSRVWMKQIQHSDVSWLEFHYYITFLMDRKPFSLPVFWGFFLWERGVWLRSRLDWHWNPIKLLLKRQGEFSCSHRIWQWVRGKLDFSVFSSRFLQWKTGWKGLEPTLQFQCLKTVAFMHNGHLYSFRKLADSEISFSECWQCFLKVYIVCGSW